MSVLRWQGRGEETERDETKWGNLSLRACWGINSSPPSLSCAFVFFLVCLPLCLTSKRNLEFKIVSLCSASQSISLQASNTWVIQRVSGECLAKFPGLGTGVTHERIKLIQCDQRENREEAVIPLHQHDTSPCFLLAPLRQVTGRWGDLGWALFGQRYRGTQCENHKPETGRLWWCARDSLQTGSTRYHSPAHSTAEDSTEKKKKKPSWHLCLESSSIESALGCSVHRQSPKGPFLGGKICAQSYFLFFIFFENDRTKKMAKSYRSRCDHMHISSFTIYRTPTARSVTFAYISTRQRNIASCCLQVLWEKGDSMQQRLEWSKPKLKLAFWWAVSPNVPP